jgi:uncharacterized protein YndB with AHSA1/START domain
MPIIEERITISAPAQAVFDLLAAPERAPEWTPNLLAVERTSDVSAGPGVETRVLANVAGRRSRGTGRCLAWDPPTQLILETRLDLGLRSVTTFRCAPWDGTTEVVARVDYNLPGGLAGLLGGFVGERLARRDLRQALANLKRLSEEENHG